MANKWSDVVNDPKYQGASDSQKQAIADGFFNDVIKPNIPSGHDVEQIKTDFMASARPTKPSVMERISAGLSDIVTPRTVVNPNKPSKPSTFKQDTESVDRLLPSVARDRVKDGQLRSVGQLVQQGYDPRGAAEKALETDSARIDNLNKQATKPVDMSYAGPMREKPQRSLGDYFKDTAGSLIKIPGAVVRDVANIGNMITADTMPTDVAGTMQRGMDEFDRRYGSDARNFENQEFGRIASNPDQDFTSQVDYLLDNPTFLADQGITTIGSMFLPAGASAGAMKVLTKLTGGKVPPGIANALRSGTIAGTVAMQNAAETFNDPDMHDVPLDVRYEAAGITALGTLLGNKIFGGGIERAIANKFNKSGAAQGFALAGKEGGQEAFESLSQSGGKAFALPGQVSLNQAVSGALMEGTMGAVMGGGAAVAMGGNGAVEQPTNTPVQPMTKGQKIIDFLKRQKGIQADTTATQEQAATPQTPQQSVQSTAQPNEAINASDILEDDNVSVPTATKSTELAAGTLSNEADNAQAGIGNQLSDGTPDVNGAGLDSRASIGGLRPEPSSGVSADASLNNDLDTKANEAATSTLNERAEPTQAQKEAGNYKVGRIKVGGLNISVENPDQSKRKGVDRDGNAWESTMNGHYGYVRGDGVKARAPDKEHIDVNVKAGTAEDYAGDVFVINQNDPKTGKFDEPKVYIGYGSEQEAEQAYRSNYAQDWQGFGGMVRMPMGKFKEMLGNEKAFLKPVKAPKEVKQRVTKRANTLLNAIDGLGGIDNKYKWDISGEQKFARGGYNKIFRNASTKTLEQHIENGDLDDFLPYEMRSTATDDATAGRNYLADRIRNGDRVLPYDVELEAKQSKYFENADIQSDIDTLIEELDLDQINSLLQEAGYDERESAAEATDYESQAGDRASENTESQSAAGSIAGDQGREASPSTAKNENTGTSGSKSQERPGVREIVTAIIRRRSAANQIGKDKAFDEYLAAAKEFLNGKDIKPARFKLASATFKNDQPLSDAYAQLAELAKAPAKEARANTSSNIDQFIQRIDQATTADQLRDIARDVQKSGLTDAQIEKLDDLAMERLDALDSQSDGGDLLGDDTAKKQAVADAERAKDAKRNTGESDSSDFVLTGSNSEADKAAARGAQDLFSQPETTKQSKSESKPANPKTTEKTAGTSLEQVTAMRDALLRLIDAKEGINFLNSGKTYLPPDRLAYEQSQASSELAAAEKQMQEAYGKDEATPFISMSVKELYDLYDLVAGNLLADVQPAQAQTEKKTQSIVAENAPQTDEQTVQPSTTVQQTEQAQSEPDYIAKESDLDAARIDNGYKHRVLSSTSGIIKIERQDYVNAVNSLYNDLLPIAKNDAQKKALKELTAEFKQEYIKRRYRVMDIGSTVVSSAVAGRSKFNSKQSSSRGNALDRAENDFSDWLKSKPAQIKEKINALKSDAELAEEKAKADEKAAKNKESLMKIMRNIDQFKRGDAVKFGTYNIARVSFDRDGYPSSVTIDATDLTDNKFELARTLFGGSKEKLRALVDEIRAENVPEPTQEAAAVEEVAQTETTPLTLFDNAMEAYRNGTATVEEYKAAFDYVLNNEQAITDYLESNFTKQQLFDRGVSERYKSEKKDRVVSAAYSDMVRDFLLPNENGIVMSQYGFGGDKYADIKRQVAEITQESLNAAMQRRQDAIKENAERRAERIKGMADPKTLEDYQALMREKTAEGMTFQDARMTLTPAQREQYDDLVASYNREQRRGAKNAQKTQVQAAVTTTSGDIVETKHTKTGEPLFVVKAAERVERETYNQWNATAKRMGGYYSSFRGNGAVPGFQFKTRENAEAFLKYLGGDVDQAKEAIQAKRDAYADDRSQTAVERLNEMADRLAADADEELTRDRKVNTARRAGMAARAEARASENKAMAVTMRNIAAAIESGKAKYLDAVRQKVQVELLQSSVSSAQQKRLREMYPSYADYEKHRYDPPTAESADYAEFPTYTLNRSDWARLGRAMVNVDGLKAIGTKILSLADDVTDAYLKFAKENIGKVSNFSRADGQRAVFKSKADAEMAIAKNGFNGKAIVLPYKRGENIVIDSPAAAKEKGVWPGDDDKRISMSSDFGKEIVEKIGRANRRANKLDMPWQLEAVYDKRQKLARMDIETPAEYRAALREFISLKETAAAPDKVKELERSMVGRRNDGLDFFPTPAEVADTMIDVADIQDGMNVLEPSAGMGHIAERIRAAGFEPDVVEFNGDRRELLELKGFNVVGNDFLEQSEKYDRIIMNPPFSNRRDEQHVRHAYELLKPGGRIVAIMGEGVFIGSDKRATEFRDWLESVGGTSEKLPDGTFNDASLPVNTSANARMIVINKPDYDDTPVFSRKDDSAPAFYSQLSKAIEQAKFESSPGKQWKLWLLGNASKLGVKKDEIQWTGITDWLELQTGKVSKADIQAYLDSNGVQVTETMLGEGGMPRLPDGWEVERQPNGEYYLLDQDGEVISEGETERQAIENGMDMDELAENPDAAGDTKYSKYVVPGGENYKELLLTLPYKSNAPTYEQWKDNQLFLDENNDVSRKKYDEEIGFYNERGTYAKSPIFKSDHWSQPNILAHVRFDERTDADGKRVLFLNEIQSDWGQEGKKKGFAPKEPLTDRQLFDYKVLKGKALRNELTDAERVEYNRLGSMLGNTPAAPFVTDTKAWVSLAIKRMLRYAVDNGFDKVAFINGQQAADLYDLSKQVDSIDVEIAELGKDVTINLPAERQVKFSVDDNGKIYSQFFPEYAGKQLSDVVGKEVAEKILSATTNTSLTGIDLRVGGEGMRAFYDQIVPQVANDVLKKLGGSRIEETTFFAPIELRGEDFDAKAITITPEMAAAISSGQPLFKRDSGLSSRLTYARAQEITSELQAKYPNLPTVKLVQTREDIPLPESVKDEINNAIKNKRGLLEKAQKAETQPEKYKYLMKSLSVKVNDVEGMYQNGQVWINVGAIQDEARLREVFAHETIGHLSIEAMLNEVDKGLFPKLLKNVQNLNKMGNKYIQEVWNDVARKQPGLSASNHAKEVLAFIVERGDQNKEFTPMVRTLWQRIVDGIKAFAKLVFDVDLNDSDVRDIMSMAERYAKGDINKSDLASVMAGGNAYFSLADRSEVPDTITVDGIERPTRNSNGQPIYPTIDGIKKFWEWFNDVGAGGRGDASLVQDVRKGEFTGRTGRTDDNLGKGRGVLDLQGRPAVLYHGTSDSFDTFELGHKNQKDLGWLGNGIYLTNDPQLARFYAEQKKGDAAPNIMPVYAAIKNPYLATVADKARLKNATKGEINTFTDSLKAKGYDGVLLEYNDEESELVVFDNNQIKSATGNNGGFDGNNSNILFSRSQMPLQPDWDSLNESGLLTDLKYKFQDKHADLKDVIKAIKATGREISDRFNPYLQEELYHGRVAKRIQDFTNKELEPLLKAMNESGVSMADFEHFLWARHAEERNAQIAKINPDMPDGGSGLTNKEATDYLAQIPARQMATFKKLAEQVDAINARSRNFLVEYGLEDMDTAAKMEEAYKHYVPLMRDEMEKGHGSGTGQGFSIKGNSTKRAMGSNKAVVDIIANIAAQREKFIVRGEKNRVSTALVGLAKMNPNDDFWKVDKPPVIRYISSVTGLVEEMTDPNYKSRNNVVVARILDRRGRVQERAVVFNEYDERALRMAESLKNLDVDGMEEWIGTLAKGTRYFASVNTQYNPLFGVVNITRDIQAGALNLESTKLAGMQKEVIGQTYNAWLGIYKDLRNTRKGKKTAGHWSELWEEYQSEGGQTGYRELFRTAKDRTDELNKIVDPDWWKKKGWGKVVSLNSEVIANAEALAADKVGKKIFQWLDDYNASLENSVRLAAYKAGLDKGLSKQEAASIAKNLTVNFNRKGAAGSRMGAFYAFFNASVQGTARIGETMFKDGNLSGVGKKILSGGILLGVIQALALAGFDDEEPPQFERDRNLIMPIGGNKYVKIPMPLGFHVIPATARILTEYALNGGEDTAKMIAHLGEVFADAFNPVGGSSSLAQIVSPTIFDPVVDLTINEDFAGRQIAQKDFNSLDPTPGFTRAKDTASRVSTVLAHVLNNMTGGTDYQPGVFSPTPDQIDYLTGQVFGGVGREILKIDSFARSMADGTDLPTYKIPLVGKFYGDAASKSSEGRKFYANIERMNGHENEIKGRNADGKPVQPYLDANPDARLWRQSKFIYSTVKKMQKRRDALLKSGAPADEIQEIDTRITQRMKALNDMVDSAKK